MRGKRGNPRGSSYVGHASAAGASAVLALAAVLVGCSHTSATGAACDSNSDCSSTQSCVYSIAQGCSSHKTCEENPTGPACDLVVMYCGCDGSDVSVHCSEPAGYAPAPVSGRKSASCSAVPGDGG